MFGSLSQLIEKLNHLGIVYALDIAQICANTQNPEGVSLPKKCLSLTFQNIQIMKVIFAIIEALPSCFLVV